MFDWPKATSSEGGATELKEPKWLQGIDYRYLRDNEQRHSWMCAQLEMRRRSQMRLTNSGKNGIEAIGWYQRQFENVLSDCHVNTVVEVLSDGLGYIEPNWSAISAVPEEAKGIAKISSQQLTEKKKMIMRARASVQAKFKTQRAIGKDLYEPGLFLVTEDEVYFHRPEHFDGNMKDGVVPCLWSSVLSDPERGVLPLMAPSSSTPGITAEIGHSLLHLTKNVLWPSLLPGKSASNCFSIVLIYTSLWQETAGVWALHAAGDAPPKPLPRSLRLSSLRALIEPTIFCLEDVLGWSCEFEGTHRWKRNNVNFLYECLAKDSPPWTPDGIDYGPAGVQLKDSDRIAYELSVDRLPSASIRDVFQQAVIQYLRERTGQDALDFTALSSAAKKVVRSTEGAVIGVRLSDISESLATEFHLNKAAIGLSDLPDTASLYLGSAESDLDILVRNDQTVMDRANLILAELTRRTGEINDNVESTYCLTVIECFQNYLEKLTARQPAQLEASTLVEHAQR